AGAELFAGRTNAREIRAGTRTALKDARFAHDAVEDAALVEQIVFDGKDVTLANLRVLVRVARFYGLAALRIDVIVALRGAGDAVRPVQSGVKKLRRIRRADLACQHRLHLVEVNARVFLGVEVAVLEAPVRPAAGQAIEDSARIAFSTAFRARRFGAPQPLGHVLFRNRPQIARHARFTAIFLRQDVDRDLAPAGRHHDVLGLENH